MKVKENYSYLLNRVILGLHNFLSVTIGVLLIFLCLRLVELGFISYSYSGIKNLVRYELSALQYDFFYYIKLSTYFFFPIVMMSVLLDFRVVDFIYKTLTAIILVGYFLLIYYFSFTLNPLGADIFSYNQDEMGLAVGASGAITWYFVLGIIVFLYLCYKVPSLVKKINWPYYVLGIYCTISVITWVQESLSTPTPQSFNKEINYFLSVNKFAYFSKGVVDNRNLRREISYDGFYYDDDLTDNSIKYLDPDRYPFLSKDTVEDVISNFMHPFSTRPNIVYIIVEGLGRSYSGYNAELGSFTPFLDSLAEKSLYWENFLSNGGRTFAVLPSSLASLPFAEKGFMELGDKMPKQQSLVRILKSNGYYTSFYHGGDANFDNMKLFLGKQNIDRVIDQNQFPKKYLKMPVNAKGFTWGYGDKELFDYYFNTIQGVEKPRLDILLTLASHSPFKVHQQNIYYKLFDKRLDELNIIGEGRLDKESYKAMYSSILYVDQQIKYFIERYKSRSDYNKTIFIITGDHRMPEIPIERRLDQFRVPLIIYSPNLKRTARIKSVSSHLDLAPSIISYLRISQNIQRPPVQSWVGSNLDTFQYFRNTKFIPLMRNKNEMLDFLDRDIFISDGRVMQVSDNLETATINDLIAQRISEGRVKQYKNKNQKVALITSLIPDSAYLFTPR